jgi:glycosyltransferase involved in cell wall biosynthesis
MRRVIPGIEEGDLVLLWAGGLYDWFDPLTLVRGVALAATQSLHVRLVFHAGRHPNPVVPEMGIVQRARRLAEDLGALGQHVFFNEEWVEYQSRGNWLLEADVGVSAHVNHVETQYSFRTRMLDYLWAGLPMLCTEGDTLGDLVRERRLGVAVPERSPEAVADAVVRLASPDFRAECSARVRATAAEYSWTRCATPLARYCSSPWRAPDFPDNRRKLVVVPMRARPDTIGLRGGVARRLDEAVQAIRGARRAYRRGGASELVAGARRRLRPPDTPDQYH